MRNVRSLSFLSSAVVAAIMCAGQPALPQVGGNVLDLPPVEELVATRERPLFAPSRRPAPVAAAPRPAGKALPPIQMPYELTGIVSSDEVRLALLHDKTTSEDVKVAPGEVAGDWEVESVADKFVILRAADRRVRLWLIDFKSPPGIDVQPPGVSGGGAPAPVSLGEGEIEEIVPPPLSRSAADSGDSEGSRPTARRSSGVIRAGAARTRIQP